MDPDKEWFDGKTIFSHPSLLTYVLDIQKHCLIGAVHLSTNNIFC